MGPSSERLIYSHVLILMIDPIFLSYLPRCLVFHIWPFPTALPYPIRHCITLFLFSLSFPPLARFIWVCGHITYRHCGRLSFIPWNHFLVFPPRDFLKNFLIFFLCSLLIFTLRWKGGLPSVGNRKMVKSWLCHWQIDLFWKERVDTYNRLYENGFLWLMESW